MISAFRILALWLAIATVHLTYSQTKLPTPQVESILYLGENEKQPLVVGIGGSEGGNAWASDRWKATRELFLKKGYAFLSIGYFGCEGTPQILDKIAIDHIHNAIKEATKNKKINAKKIAVIGGSRGADLALLLASYYSDISCVVGMSSSHAVFPGHTHTFNSSCWTFQGLELPYVPVNDSAIPFLMKRDLRSAFIEMLGDTVAEKKALIPVEKIKGSVLLISATQDEMIPAVAMGQKMIHRLKLRDIDYKQEHMIVEGTHVETTKHFDKVLLFLEENFIQK